MPCVEIHAKPKITDALGVENCEDLLDRAREVVHDICDEPLNSIVGEWYVPFASSNADDIEIRLIGGIDPNIADIVANALIRRLLLITYLPEGTELGAWPMIPAKSQYRHG